MAHSKHVVFLSVVIAALVWAFASTADAQNTFPRLEPGRLVYGIPSGYINPGVGTAGADRLERELHTIHHPFFVVFIDRLPGNEEPNAEATHLLENLMVAWRANQPDLCPPEASAFLQITTPRKYRLTAGSRWVAQLNLGAEQVTQFGTEHFVPYMRLRPEDPTTGILETARAIDTYVFEATDPEILRQRQEAAERRAADARRAAEAQAEQRRLEEHANSLRELSNELYRAGTLLTNEPRYLPSNLGGHALAVDEARTIQQRTDAATQQIQDATAHLRDENNALERSIDDQKSAESTAAVLSVLKLAALVILVIVIFLLVRKQNRKVRELRMELEKKLAAWQKKVDNALVRYVAFDDQRDAMRSLATKQGRTAKLYTDVTSRVDGIFVLIEALRTHLGDSATMGAKGWFFNTDPLHKAIELVDEVFTFDTGVVDQARLFHPQTVQKEINPATIEKDLAGQFKTAMAGWDELREAHSAGNRDPRTDLPFHDFEMLRTRATDGQVPNEWLNGHPLARDAEGTYERLGSLRDSDAVAYCEEIDRLRAQARDTGTLVDEIIKLVEPIFGNSANATIPDGTFVDANDSPSPHLEAAMRGEGELSGMLKALRPKSELQSKIDMILRERSEAAKKAELVRFCVEKADEAIKSADAERVHALRDRATAEGRISKVRTVHAEIDEARATTGNDRFKLGESSLEGARLALANKRHVTARRLALESHQYFQEAVRGYGQVGQYCDVLDQAVLDAGARIRSGIDTQTAIILAKGKVVQRVADAGRTHANIREAERLIERAGLAISSGQGALHQARTASTERRYAKATSLADSALASFRTASTAIEDANQWCIEQDRKKAEYDAFIAEADRYRNSAASRISGAGRTAHLAVFRPVHSQGPTDYAAAMLAATSARTAWDGAARKAEAERDEEERAARRKRDEEERRAAAHRREEEERDRRRRDEEDARRRRDEDSSRNSYSGSSSTDSWSSGSSVGGGDSGSSGSSVGGGDY